MIERDWRGCYGESWKGVIIDEAFSHPAKFSRALIRRIYAHAFERGWLRAGDAIADPFGGVALGALEAMRRGLCWWGVELEPRFVGLGRENIALWNATYAKQMPGWGTAHLLQGDSRELARLVAEAGAVVSSPPYASGRVHASSIDADKFANPERAGRQNQAVMMDDYGTTPGQLAALPEGDFAAAVGSPPFSHPGEQPCASQSQALKDYHAFTRGDGTKLDHQMTTPGQLAALPAGDFAAAVSSPPWESVDNVSHSGLVQKWCEQAGRDKTSPCRLATVNGYGDTSGQLGQESSDTFWTAARAIVEQTREVLRPGGVAIWVVKAFVRDGQRVDFPGQWRQLGEACGFETLEWIRAWLVEDRGTQLDLFGNEHKRQVERKGFFRRLAEKKARAAELWPTFSRSERARYLQKAHAELWEQYYQMEAKQDEMHPPILPTRTRILGSAQMQAYIDANEPDLKIDTSIDYEVVLVQRKRGGR